LVKPWSIYVDYFRGVDGYAPREIALGFDLSFSISASLALLREIQPIITQFDFDHVSPSLTKQRRKRSNLGIVASQQQAPKQGPQLALSAWRDGPIAPLHHGSASGFGADRRHFRRSGVVKRGRAWSMLACRADSGRPGEQGPWPTVCRSGTPRHTFRKFFAAQKNLGFPTFAKCPRIGGKAVRLGFLDAG